MAGGVALSLEHTLSVSKALGSVAITRGKKQHSENRSGRWCPGEDEGRGLSYSPNPAPALCELHTMHSCPAPWAGAHRASKASLLGHHFAQSCMEIPGPSLPRHSLKHIESSKTAHLQQRRPERDGSPGAPSRGTWCLCSTVTHSGLTSPPAHSPPAWASCSVND